MKQGLVLLASAVLTHVADSDLPSSRRSRARGNPGRCRRRRTSWIPVFDRHGRSTRPLQGYSFSPPLTPPGIKGAVGARSELPAEDEDRRHSEKKRQSPETAV